MVMHMKTCCCGCSLKAGTVFIGVVSGIGALIFLVINILGASVGTGELNLIGSNKTLSVFTICSAIVFAIQLILSIVLVFVASAEQTRLIKPWIVYAILNLIVQTALGLWCIITFFVHGAVTPGVLGLVGLGIYIIFAVYFILIVNSFHTELISSKRPEQELRKF